MRVKAENVDAYIAAFPPNVAGPLEQLRTIIRNTAPGAEETISYAIPSYKLNGMLVHFAGYVRHIGFYPGAAGIANFIDELAKFKTSKGAVQFPLDRPIPYDLIRRMVQYKLEEIMASSTKKRI